MIVAAPDEEVVVACLPHEAGVVARVEAGLVLGGVRAVVALRPVHHVAAALQLQLDVILLHAVNLRLARLSLILT